MAAASGLQLARGVSVVHRRRGRATDDQQGLWPAGFQRELSNQPESLLVPDGHQSVAGDHIPIPGVPQSSELRRSGRWHHYLRYSWLAVKPGIQRTEPPAVNFAMTKKLLVLFAASTGAL